MNKLVFGVGVNDLGYRTQVKEYVTKDGGERVLKPVFICKYYTAWRDMLKRCYSKKSLERNPNKRGRLHTDQPRLGESGEQHVLPLPQIRQTWKQNDQLLRNRKSCHHRQHLNGCTLFSSANSIINPIVTGKQIGRAHV